MAEAFVFDAYALIEILKANPRYLPYLDKGILTTKLALFEVYYSVLREDGISLANQFLGEFYSAAIDFDEIVLRQAAQLKLSHRKQNLSMADCIGYALACRLGIKFLTGDQQFQSIENVEFVK